MADLTGIKTKSIYYDYDGEDMPAPGRYIVSITSKGEVGSVYQIADVRKPKASKYPNRFNLKVLSGYDFTKYSKQLSV